MARGSPLSQGPEPRESGPRPDVLTGTRHSLFAGVAALVAAVVYGPMLLPGYPLRFDLVSVPRPVLGEDALGLGDRLPRAIPLDAATALLAHVLPDAWVTQFLGLAALVLAGWGVAVLTPGPLPGRLLALLVAEWNPFVMEQLSIGHIPHLCAYGVLPWVAICARSLTRGGTPAWFAWAGLAAATGFGSLTPGGGALCGVAAVAGLLAGVRRASRGRVRRGVLGVLTVAVLQLPWLVAAVAAPAFAAPAASAESVNAFALQSETGWGRLVDAAGLAGMWNDTALPASRHTVLARASTVLLLALAAAGLAGVRRRYRAGFGPEILAGAGAMAVGYVIAVLPVLPGGGAVLEKLIAVVPGAGLLRDGHRWLALPAIGIAVLAGVGVGELAARLPAADEGARVAGRVSVALLAGLLVVATMPDEGLGLAGRLRAWHYPAEWAQVRSALDRAPDRSRVLVLPFQPFRRFSWSGRDAVLDPAPRLLPRQTIVSDALTVAGTTLPPEGLGARAITADLADGRLTQSQLGALAIGWILIEHDTPGELPELPAGWQAELTGSQLTLLKGPAPSPPAPRAAAGRVLAVVGSQVLAGAVLLSGLLGLLIGLLGWRSRTGRSDGEQPSDDVAIIRADSE